MKLENNWQQKSLENLEKTDEGMPGDDYSNLVNRVLKLRKRPLNQFSIEDIRLMIGQKQGLKYLIALSINVLKNDLLAEGDYYPGDLLGNILSVDSSFWIENKTLWSEINNLIKDKLDVISEQGISTEEFYDTMI